MSKEAQQAEPAQPEKPKPPKPKTSPLEQFGLFVAFILGMVILIDPVARQATGAGVGLVLEPAIGFGRSLPALTVLLASGVMVVITSSVRHYFTDYLKLARNQEVMRAFQREMKSARKENNLHRIKKLTEKNKDLMQIQAEQSTAQLKPMALTMVVVVPIFAWLLVFLDPGSAVPGQANVPCESLARVPWEQAWCMDINIQASPLTFLPRWVALYSLFSIPIGQVIARVLKAHDLRAELARQQGP